MPSHLPRGATRALAGALLLSSTRASAAGLLLFPTSRSVVPLAVVGAFVLPAAMAGLFVGPERFGRVLGPSLAICVLVATVATLIGFSQSGVLSPPGS